MGKWNDFLLSRLARLREGGNYCDTEISTSDSCQFTAHACVLVAASPVLQSLFQDVVSVKKISLPYSSDIVRLVLDYIYLGTVTIPVNGEIVNQLLTFSQGFQLRQLSEICLSVQKMLVKNESLSKTEKTSMSKVTVTGDSIQVCMTTVANADANISKDNKINENINLQFDDEGEDDAAVELLTEDPVTNPEHIPEGSEVPYVIQMDGAELPIDMHGQMYEVVDGTAVHTTLSNDLNTGVKIDSNIEDNTQLVKTDVDVSSHSADAPGPSSTVDWGNRPDNPEEFPEHLKAFAVKPGEEPISDCTFCKLKFSSRTKCFTHMRDLHPLPGIIRCRICLQDFPSVNALRFHKKKKHHSAPRKFECEICGEVKESTSHMKYHMTKHTGEKPYVCSFCGKTFRIQGALDIHLRVHTGEKPYTCEYCNRSFANASNCLTHRKRMHKHDASLLDPSTL